MKKFDPEMYTISVQKVVIDKDVLYVAKVAELSDVQEYADTESEARALAIDTICTAYAMFEEQGLIFPEPNLADETPVSGRLTLRMPKSVHSQLIKEANKEDASLNQVVLTALTSYLDKQSTARVIESTLGAITSAYKNVLSVQADFGMNERKLLSTHTLTTFPSQKMYIKMAPLTLQYDFDENEEDNRWHLSPKSPTYPSPRNLVKAS
ncbi:MAG: hypothetical protein CVV11_06705 [Gammaproteobacteria bacterium HGW-Gammaproteobacteria-15]|nr:MAG: hypothetical protein CVV11_06705 [Gammaproteobacteria bacterium HGW-Gammaproteobacteria-15]